MNATALSPGTCAACGRPELPDIPPGIIRWMYIGSSLGPVCTACSVVEDLRLMHQLLIAHDQVVEVVRFVSSASPRPEWAAVYEAVRKGETFSKALAASPLPGLRKNERELLVAMTAAGELGGFLHLVLQRFVQHYPTLAKGQLDPITEFLALFELLLSSGVPVLRALAELRMEHPKIQRFQTAFRKRVVKNLPVGEAFRPLIGRQHAALIHNGDEVGELPAAIREVVALRAKGSSPRTKSKKRKR